MKELHGIWANCNADEDLFAERTIVLLDPRVIQSDYEQMLEVAN